MLQLIRDTDATAGAIDKLAICDTQGGLVTAVRNGSGNLELIAWSTKQKSSTDITSVVSRMGSITGGAIADVAIGTVRIAQHGARVVTAERTAENDLTLVVWDLSTNGTFTKRGHASAQTKVEGKPVVVAPGVNGDGWTVTATRLQDGTLRLHSWQIDDAGGITRKHSTDAGLAQHLALVGTGIGVLVALRDSDGNLKLVHWLIDSSGNFKRTDSAGAGPVSEVAACVYTIEEDAGFTNPRHIVMTTVKNGSGKLEIIAWSAADDTSGKITRKGSITLSVASEIATTMVGVAFEGNRLMTAVKDASGNLALTLLRTQNDNSQFVTEASAAAGAVSDIAVASFGGRYVATAVRTPSGDLKLVTWHTWTT